MQTSNEFEDEQNSPRLDVSQAKTKLGKEKVQELVVPQPDQAVRYLQIAATGIFFVQTGWALAGNNQPGNVVRVKLGLTEYEWTSTYNQLVTCAGILGLTIGAVAATCPLKYGRKEVRGGFLAAAVLGLALSLFANIWSIIAGRLLHGFATGVHLSAGPRDLMGEFDASPANKRN
jgi:MFS family permease